MKKYMLALCCISITGCVSTPEIKKQETRFQTKVVLSEFNSIASQFMAKPTFAAVITYPNGESPELLNYSADGYGSNYSQYIGVTKNVLGFQVQKTRAVEFIKAIDKYLEWSGLATERREEFTKDISKIPYDPSQAAGIDVYYKITFHSGNASSHYMLVKSCTYSGVTKETCMGDTALGKDSAAELKKDITKFANGEISQLDVSSKYN